VLGILASADGPLSVGDVAALTRTDQSTVSVVVSRLVDRGLVKRERHRGDARRVELSLTARGRSLQKRGPSTVAQQKLSAALESLAPRDAATLMRLLRRIVDAMGIGDEPPAMLFDDGKSEARPARRRTRAAS
jgi:DNA-binding MarR family transcriptional regulator